MRSCEVEEKRPSHPNSASSQSNQDAENDYKSALNEQGSEKSVEDIRKSDETCTDNNSMEINNQRLPNGKDNSQMDEEPDAESGNLSRRRKQKTPAKVVSYVAEESDDDITDDETQTYSIDSNIEGNGPGYEETFSQNLTMESSSPVF